MKMKMTKMLGESGGANERNAGERNASEKTKAWTKRILN